VLEEAGVTARVVEVLGRRPGLDRRPEHQHLHRLPARAGARLRAVLRPGRDHRRPVLGPGRAHRQRARPEPDQVGGRVGAERQPWPEPGRPSERPKSAALAALPRLSAVLTEAGVRVVVRCAG
jgi:hypothetical protein